MSRRCVTAVQILLTDAQKVQLDNYRRRLENIPARGTVVRELALIGLRAVEAGERVIWSEGDTWDDVERRCKPRLPPR